VLEEQLVHHGGLVVTVDGVLVDFWYLDQYSSSTGKIFKNCPLHLVQLGLVVTGASGQAGGTGANGAGGGCDGSACGQCAGNGGAGNGGTGGRGRDGANGTTAQIVTDGVTSTPGTSYTNASNANVTLDNATKRANMYKVKCVVSHK
jgi:hypothetical protein